MNYDGLLASIGQAKAPKRTNAWKTITGNKTAFMTWFNSQSSTQEQKLKAAYPQLFAALAEVV